MSRKGAGREKGGSREAQVIEQLTDWITYFSLLSLFKNYFCFSSRDGQVAQKLEKLEPTPSSSELEARTRLE